MRIPVHGDWNRARGGAFYIVPLEDLLEGKGQIFCPNLYGGHSCSPIVGKGLDMKSMHR